MASPMIDPARCKVISFDCAQTLLRVSWDPGVLIVRASELIGLEFDRQVGQELYMRLLGTRYREYQALCLTRDEARSKAWWRELTCDWLERLSLPLASVEELSKAADKVKFDEPDPMFSLYEDVKPTLTRLKGKPLMVISNWDTSIHEFLRHYEIADAFQVVAASDEYGVAKPDPQFFKMACADAGIEPEDVVHIGDHYIEDFSAAREAGMQALHLDRSGGGGQYSIQSLAEVPALLGL